MAGQHHLYQRRAYRRAGRASRNADGSWTASYGPVVLGIIAHRDYPAPTKTQRLWTCGQRSALPARPTAATVAATTLNKTRNVLPMSPVRSVTYVAGCSSARSAAGEGAYP